MGGVRTLLAPRLEQAERPATLEQLLQQQHFRAAGEQAVPEFAQHRKVETRIAQVETQQILPVNAGADGLRRLAIGEVLAELHDRYQCEPPRGQSWLAIMRIEGGK